MWRVLIARYEVGAGEALEDASQSGPRRTSFSKRAGWTMVGLQKSDLLHHPQESFHPAARETTSRRSLQQNTSERHRSRVGHAEGDEGLNCRKEQIERTNLMAMGQMINFVTQWFKLESIETHSGRKNEGKIRASEKATGDRENGFESTVSTGVGCCFPPLGT